ncbi:MAG: ribosome silencing factor [Candidatus Kaelpia aquatica]|nr:ribosome silencing factor [Candidatus Kaelpia aquatica]
MDSYCKARLIAGLTQDKGGNDVVLMHIGKLVSFADFFVICSADSARQVKAIVDHVISSTKNNKIKIWHSEGYEKSDWVLLDYGDIVVHVFTEEQRLFYELERLWSDLPLEHIEAA